MKRRVVVAPAVLLLVPPLPDPAGVAGDTGQRNAQEYSDKQNARIEHDKALGHVIIAMMNDDTVRFKQFVDNEGFKPWVTDTLFRLAYEQPAAAEHQHPADGAPRRNHTFVLNRARW